MRGFAMLAIMVLGVAACTAEGTTIDNPWTEPTVAFDETCEGCVEVGHGHVAHAGEGRSMLLAAGVDDAISQWADCMESVLSCVEVDGASVAECVAQGDCPTACKDRFDELASAANDFGSRYDAFETVFVAADAPCMPADPGPEGFEVEVQP